MVNGVNTTSPMTHRQEDAPDMDTFDKREEGFELAFSHSQELRFRARARRNRKLGQWAGAKLGLSGPPLEGYAAGFVDRAIETGDDEILVADLVQALAPAQISEHRVRRRLEEFELAAMQEIQAGR
jgi:hypothetical protein